MSDLDEARMLLEKIAAHNKANLGNPNTTYITLAVELLLKDYIARATHQQAAADKLS